MRLATIEESRQIDLLSQKEFGLSGEILMEAAGTLAYREITQSFRLELASREPLGIICGPGNNGADGLVVARHAHAAGRAVWVFLLTPEDKQSPLFRLQLERCRKLGIEFFDLSLAPQNSERFARCALVVDAVFGIGYRVRPDQGLPNEIQNAFCEINQAHVPVVSLDVPSGLDADRGIVCEAAVRATQTITFGLAKPGFFVSQGPEHIGRLRILSIGFPYELTRSHACSHFAVTERSVRGVLPRRRLTSNKTHHGHVAIFAGRPGMWGAARLAASTAYRIGAGYVTLASFEDSIGMTNEAPAVLTARVQDETFWSKRRWQVAAVGPGLGVRDETADLLKRLKGLDLKGVVVDADAITMVAERKMRDLPKSWVLTPHAGELSRVLDVSAAEIEGDRFRYAREAAKLLGCRVLLKGFRPVLASPDGTREGGPDRMDVILSGNAALAKAGTGDVLTGMIAGMLAQGVEPRRAAAAAAYLHGRLADDWVRSGHDQRSLVASDLPDLLLPTLMKRLMR